jgi:transposase
MDAHVRFSTQVVGALPIVVHYVERLQLRAIIDELIPWEGNVPLGTLTEILVINRLLQPKAMFRIGDWAQQAGLTDYYGISAEQLNDDLLGRGLERLAKHREAAEPGVVVRAIKTFRLRVNQVHFDLTDVELYGAYELNLAEGETPPRPLPTYGRTKSGRKNVKQINLGLNVSGDGGVPLGHLPLDGNVAESTTHLENLRRLRSTLGRSDFLYTADTKLDTPENLLEIAGGDGHFLCGGAFLPHLQQRYSQLREKLQPVDYAPQSQARLPPEQRDPYRAVETMETLEGVVDGRQVRLKYRLIFVWSQAKAKQEAQTRKRHLDKVREEFEAVQRNLGKYSLKTKEAITRRLEGAKAKYTEGKLFEYDLQQDRRGVFHLTWQINSKALREVEELDGVYLLKTNLPKKKHPTAAILRDYKGQSRVERRFHHLKGPLAVAPMFLKNPERIAGLLFILVLALLVMALMERQVRRQLNGKPLYGLYPENRPSPAPTGPAILDCFSTLSIVIAKEHDSTSRRLAELSSVQRTLCRLLSIPPDGLRTFKRRCGM